MAKWLILLAILGACGAREVVIDDEDPGTELGIERALSCKEAGTFACGAWLKGEHITWRCSGPSVEEVRAHQKAWAGSGPLCRADDDRAGVLDEFVKSRPRLFGMVDVADRLGMAAVGAEPLDLIKGKFRPRGDHQIVV